MSYPIITKPIATPAQRLEYILAAEDLRRAADAFHRLGGKFEFGSEVVADIYGNAATLRKVVAWVCQELRLVLPQQEGDLLLRYAKEGRHDLALIEAMAEIYRRMWRAMYGRR